MIPLLTLFNTALITFILYTQYIFTYIFLFFLYMIRPLNFICKMRNINYTWNS
jgi:hypothetical protein